MSRARERVLVSAHRFGAGADRSLAGQRPALEAALAAGVDYVEFDVQRCADGALVVSHDARVPVGEDRVRIASLSLSQLRALAPAILTYGEVLTALDGRARAHIDLKLTSPTALYADPATTYEAAAARLAVARLGADQVLFTTLHDRSARALRDHATAEGVDLLVGLSLGRSVNGLTRRQQVRVRWSELRPARRFRESGANLVVAKHTLARWGVASFARRNGLPLLVWTVDTPGSLRHWLTPGRAWLVTTNHPHLALRVRAGRSA